MKLMNIGLSSTLLIALSTLLGALSACGSDSEGGVSAGGAGGTKPVGSAGAHALGGDESGDAGARADGGAGGEGGESSEGGEGGEGGAPANDSLYALTTQIIGEQSQSYVLLTRNLEGEETLKIEDGVVEVVGRALGTGPENGGALFVANDSSAEIARYDLTDEDGLKPAGKVSFLGKGLTAFGEYGGQMQYVSSDKAYWFDGPTAQVVVWNPTKMEVTGSIPLAGLPGEKLTMSFTAAPVRIGSKLYTFVAWRQGVTIVPRAAVVVVDSATDTATIAEDTRCGYARDGVFADDGKIYVATEAFGAAAQFLDVRNPKPCLLRFDPETDAFDSEFSVELSSLFGGHSAGSLVVGPNNQAFLRVLDETSASEAALAGPRQLASSSSWGWAKLNPGDQPKVERIPGAGLGGGSVIPFKLGKRAFAPRFVEATYTEFVELSDSGPLAQVGLTIPGLVFSAVKLR